MATHSPSHPFSPASPLPKPSPSNWQQLPSNRSGHTSVKVWSAVLVIGQRHSIYDIPRSQPHTHTHTHTPKRTHTHTHTHTHPYTQTHTHRLTQALSLLHTHAHTHTLSLSHTHTHTHTMLCSREACPRETLRLCTAW